MKTKFFTSAIPLAAGLLSLVPAAQAQFQYQNQDLMAVFRQTGSPNLDLEVDLGQASIYYNLRQTAPGSTIAINSYNSTQFSATFSSALGLEWAVMGAVPVGSGTLAHPAKTVWLTEARANAAVQSTPWQRDSGSAEGNWTSVIRGVAGAGSTVGAAVFGQGTPPDAISNSPTVLIIGNSDPSSYTQIGGLNGDLAGNFGQGSIENGSTTLFTVERSDLYELAPNGAGGDGTYLGYFDLNPNGTMSFTAAPEPGTCALLSMGAFALLVVQYRKRAASRA